MDEVPISANGVQTVAEPASEEPALLDDEPAKSLQMQVERNDAGQFLRASPAIRPGGSRAPAIGQR